MNLHLTKRKTGQKILKKISKVGTHAHPKKKQTFFRVAANTLSWGTSLSVLNTGCSWLLY